MITVYSATKTRATAAYNSRINQGLHVTSAFADIYKPTPPSSKEHEAKQHTMECVEERALCAFNTIM